MKIIIGGDLVPTQSNRDMFIHADVTGLMGKELYDIYGSADIRLFNLEAPLTKTTERRKKSGPSLKADPETILGIEALKPTAVTLANNHIMDYGVPGLKDTMDLLSKYDIPYVGVGNNVGEAKKPYIIEKKGYRIGVYACTENEFSSASDECAGANPVDYLEMFDDIKNLKKNCDYIIVLYHGGKEYYQFPSPLLQKVSHKLLKSGADFVVCQHSHCIGCEENINEGRIVYGQGNFIFDGSNDRYWMEGMLTAIEIEGKNASVSYYPFEKDNGKIRLKAKEQSAETLKAFRMRSEEILDKEFLKRNYIEFAKKKSLDYIKTIHGYNWRLQLKNKLLGKNVAAAYSEEEFLAIQNIIECEAHRELFLQYLKERN